MGEAGRHQHTYTPSRLPTALKCSSSDTLYMSHTYTKSGSYLIKVTFHAARPHQHETAAKVSACIAIKRVATCGGGLSGCSCNIVRFYYRFRYRPGPCETCSWPFFSEARAWMPLGQRAPQVRSLRVCLNPPQRALERTEWNIICRMNWC